ncbi:hypothetical protein Mapa_006269 [Marchantia paleacea]|nr:hypothetical protein Mapa_006269 [Marchantia paleacea]
MMMAKISVSTHLYRRLESKIVTLAISLHNMPQINRELHPMWVMMVVVMVMEVQHSVPHLPVPLFLLQLRKRFLHIYLHCCFHRGPVIPYALLPIPVRHNPKRPSIVHLSSSYKPSSARPKNPAPGTCFLTFPKPHKPIESHWIPAQSSQNSIFPRSNDQCQSA